MQDITKTLRNEGIVIGNTSLARIPEEILRHYGVKNKNINIYSKLEWENPSSSIKARAAFYMIMDGINRGKLTPETTLIEASSGNTGAGESLIGQVLGYNVEIIVPKGTSKEKTKKSTDAGAKIIYSPRERGTDGAQVMVNELLAEYPDKYFNPNQYDNQANIEAHILTTGPEIINQLRNIGENSLDVFVAMMGTGGTIVGNTKALRLINPQLESYGAIPDNWAHGFVGIKHLESVNNPGNLIKNPGITNSTIEVNHEEAYMFGEYLIKKGLLFNGKLPGPSGLGNLLAAIKIAKEKDGKSNIATVFPDSMTNYSEDEYWGPLSKQ